MKNNYLKGVLCCLIATVAWGCMFPVMTSALLHLDPFNFTAMRYAIAGAGFTAILLFKEGTSALRLAGEKVFLAWFLGTCGFAGFGFLVFWGQKLAGPTGALTASITMATMPLLGILVNWLVRGLRPLPWTLFFILLSFCGVALVITHGDITAVLSHPENFNANLLILLGALCWVVYTIGGSFFPTWSPYRYTTITTLLGLTSIFAINAVLLMTGYIQWPSPGQIISVTPHLFYMALVAGLIGVLCWNIGNKIITPVNGVLFMDVVPITAFTVSALTGVVPVPAQILGASITAIALIMNNLYQRRKQIIIAKPTPTTITAEPG